MRLHAGSAYYRVTWMDPALTIPCVEAFIYVGANILEEDDPSETRYYFQDPISFRTRPLTGPVGDDVGSDEMQARVVSAEEQELGSSWVDLQGAIEQLQAAATRAGRLK